MTEKNISEIAVIKVNQTKINDNTMPNNAEKTDDTEIESTLENNEPKEVNGYENKAEPTRYGDWEIGGRCYDF